MKKIILILGIVLLGVVVSLYFFSSNETTEPDGQSPWTIFPGGDTPRTDTNPVGSNTPLVIQTATGDRLEVRNFIADPEIVEDEANAGLYHLGNRFPSGNATQNVTPEYTVSYIRSTDYFNVGLFKEPLGESRRQAELDLMRRLGLTEAEMCSLDYMVSTPHWVNEFYAGSSLGFSFCPGSVPLE